MTDAPIRDAATIVLVRDMARGPAVLMGQRGAGASFMPSKFVFPGGAVDDVDHGVPVGRPLSPACRKRLASRGPAPETLAAAAIRELWEEAGLILGTPGTWPDPPQGWRGFAGSGHLPDAGALTFIFRAITPPGRTRRFDARFFLARADDLRGDPDDFAAACDELSSLQWVPLAEVRRVDLPFITEVVLAEVSARLRGTHAEGVPFFNNDTDRSEFLRL